MAPKLEFDLTSFDPRRIAIIVVGLLVIISAGIAIFAFTLSGKEDNVAEITPSPRPTYSPTAPPTSAGPPTETPTVGPTPTLEPYSHTVQSGQTLLYIIGLFGYRDPYLILDEVVALNGLPGPDGIYEGQELIIPRQTATIGPTFTATNTLDPLITPTITNTPLPTIDPLITPNISGCSPENRCMSPDGQYWYHEVRETDTIARIAYEYDSTISCILRTNNLPADPVIYQGQLIKVCLLVTLTPTLTPTGGPDSTATPTPTPSAPSLVAPAMDEEISRSDAVVLQWAAARPLARGESYLVMIRNVDSGEEWRFVTRSNTYRLPSSLQPGAGRSIRFEWRVVVIRGTDPDSPVISGPGQIWIFTWG